MMTLKDALEDFMLEQQFRGNTPKTQLYYQGSINRFVRFVGEDTDVSTIRIPLLREYYASLTKDGLSSNSTQTYIRSLRTFLTYCYEQEYIEIDLSKI